MKKGLTEIVFILDRSGSMSGLEADTIGGFNSMIEKQKKIEGDALITTVLFDDKIQLLHDRVALDEVSGMTQRDYYVGGCTALLDAIGETVKRINDVQKALAEEERPEKTMFIITTDGQENSSEKYDFKKIKKMIEKKQEKKQWEFLFLGANIDAIGTASSLGIKANRSVNYHSDHIGTATNYKALDKAISAFRCAPSLANVKECMEDWDADIKEDYEARKA